MLTEYAEPTTEAEMRERYASIRRKIMAAKPARRYKEAVEKSPVVVDSGPPNMCTQHIVEYRKHIHEQKVLSLYSKVLDTTERMPVIDIIRQTSASTGISIGEILGNRRSRPIVAARHMAMARAYVERPDLSLPELGRLFKREHTSILACVKKMGVWNGFDARKIEGISGLQRRYGCIPSQGA